MKTLKTTILAEGFVFLKAARWHAGSLWIADKLDCKIYCVDPDGKAKAVVAQMSGQPTGLGFLPDGTLLVASALDRRIMRLETDRLVCHVDLSAIAAGEISNMTVDRQGRAYVTSFSVEASPTRSFRTACIILVNAEGKSHALVDNLVQPRGLALTGSRQLLIAETFANRLTAFQIANDGSLSQRRLFATFEQMSPEGICLDAEGAVWTAAARQPLFVRVVQGGRITHRVHVPGRQAVACQLGGRDGQRLFCLTLAQNLESFPNRSATARVETTLVDVPGAGIAE